MRSPQIVESDVGRKKEGDEDRIGRKFTLQESTIKALEEHSSRTDAPMSRTVDRAIRAFLELDPPATPSSLDTEEG